MSQPPSLPKFTAFLRPVGPPPQQHQQDQPNAVNGRAADADEGSTRDATGKRRLDGEQGMEIHARQPLYDGGGLHQQHQQQLQEQQHKRRANLFVQYGEQQNFHPLQHHHQQHHAQRQVVGGYGSRHQPPPHHQQQQRSSPHVLPGHAPPHHLAHSVPPPLQQQQQQLQPRAFPQFAGSYDRNSSSDLSRTIPTAVGPMTSARIGTAEESSPDAHRAATVKIEPPASTQQTAVQRERKSRYLSEADRRSIIQRIEKGEKQVALAKEFQVSRAAVCNLYKNRKDVLTRADRNPKAKHPKRAKENPVVADLKVDDVASSDATPPLESGPEDKEDTSEGLQGDDDAMSDEHSSTESIDDEPLSRSVASPQPHAPILQRQNTSLPQRAVQIHNASATSAPIRRMVSILRNQHLPLTAYRQVLKRLANSLVEEVVARLPHHEVSVTTPSGYPSASILPLGVDGICGISMEPQVGTLLQAFVDIFPAASTGFVSVTRSSEEAPTLSSTWRVGGHRLPPVHGNCHVLLLVASCATGARLCAVLDHLVNQARIAPASIYVASLISSQLGLAHVHRLYPDIAIVSGAIDEAVDAHGRICPGIGDPVERFLH